MLRQFLKEFAMEHKVEAYVSTLIFIFAMFLAGLITVRNSAVEAARKELVPQYEEALHEEIQRLRNEYDEWCELPENEVEDFSLIREFGEFLF